MRAWDLMIFCICINLGIGLVAEVLHNENQKSYYQPNQGDGWSYEISNASELAPTANQTAVSGTFEMAKWAIGGMIFFVSLLSNVIWIEPALEHTFMIPPAISYILQTLIWLIYTAALIQWWSNRPFKAYD